MSLLRLVNEGAGICIDSRMAKAGDIFFAIRGEHFDGNDFVAEALEKGCVLAVVDREPDKKNPAFLKTPDVLKTLQELSIGYRAQFDTPCIGITGSNGKTTTKELCREVLSKKFNLLATSGNLNNHIGVPLTLLSLKKHHNLALIEMGANHVGEIRELSHMASPGFGLITNIGKAHLEGFGGYENVKRAKSELYDHIRQNGGNIFVQGDNDLLMGLSEGITRVTYGTSENLHCCGSITALQPFIRISYKTSKAFGEAPNGLSDTIQTRLTGAYNFDNVMAAITMGLYFGVPCQDIKDAIESWVPANNRSQIIQTSRNKVIMDAYNANPSSMEAALDNFIEFPAEKKAVILGDMLELGESEIMEHEAILNKALKAGFDQYYLVGPVFSSIAKEKENVSLFMNADEAAAYLKTQVPGNFVFLVKGSRGIRLEKTLEML